MGNYCGNLEEATAADNELKCQEKPKCCISLPCKSVCLNPQWQISNQQKSTIKPIEFIDNGDDLQKYQKENQQHQNEMATTQRIFLNTITTQYKDSDEEQNEKGKSQAVRQASDEASTKREQSQPQNSGKLIIKAKDAASITKYHRGSNISLSSLEVPFQVIKLSMSSSIISTLKLYYADFFEKYDNENSPRATQWRLLQNGTYANILANLHGAFITKQHFYEGFFICDENKKYIPDEKGLVINKKYFYEGELKLGKPYGNGKLINRETQQIYDGNWFEGMLIIGVYQRGPFRYQGSFFNGQASGNGTFELKDKKIFYKGGFHQGYFDDDNARYECEKYWYEGGFRNGKKYGTGILYDKVNNRKYEGKWVEDKIKNPIIT